MLFFSKNDRAKQLGYVQHCILNTVCSHLFLVCQFTLMFLEIYFKIILSQNV